MSDDSNGSVHEEHDSAVDDEERNPAALARLCYSEAAKKIDDEDKTIAFDTNGIDVKALETYRTELEGCKEGMGLLLHSEAIRTGFLRMMEIVIQMVDLFAFAARDIFDVSSESRCQGCTKNLQVLMSMLSALCCLSEGRRIPVRSNSCLVLFVGFAGYYAAIRSPQAVDAILDLEFVKVCVIEQTVAELIVFRDWFQSNFGCRFESVDKYGIEAYKAFLLMVSMALMNVSDLTGDESVEVGSFIENFLEHEFFAESIRFLLVMLFHVATRTDSVSKVQERAVL
jgi:hypothetical protein